MVPTLTRPRDLEHGSAPPRSDEPEEGGGREPGWVTLLTAANDIEAHLLAGRLAEAGLEIRIVKDRSAPGAWMYGGANPWAPANLLVRSIYLDEARLVVAEVSFANESWEPPVPQTGGRARRALLFWSLAIGLGALLTGVGLARTSTSFTRCDLPLLCADVGTQP